MKKQQKQKNAITISTLHVETNLDFTLDEFSRVCSVSEEMIREMIDLGLIEPVGKVFHFDATHLQRVRRMLKLKRDFELNLAGAALAVELLEEMERMRKHIELLEKHWEKL